MRGIHWITEPRHSELAIVHLAHGNQADLEWHYCSAAILVGIPPFSPSRRGTGPWHEGAACRLDRLDLWYVFSDGQASMEQGARNISDS